MEAGEVAEAVGDQAAAVDLHPAQDVRARAEDQVGAGFDRHMGEGLGVAAVLAEVDLLLAADMLGVGALGAGVDRDDDDVGFLAGLADQSPGGVEVGQRGGVRVGREAEEGDLAAAGLEDRDLARQAGLLDPGAVQRLDRLGPRPLRRSRRSGCWRWT